MEEALKKLLLTMLKDEYPQIMGIVVSSTDLGTWTNYRVGLGIKYSDLLELDSKQQEILKDKVKNLSKYLLDKNEYFERTFFYDPNQF